MDDAGDASHHGGDISSNKKLVETSATLLGTSALLVVTSALLVVTSASLASKGFLSPRLIEEESPPEMVEVVPLPSVVAAAPGVLRKR